MTVSGFKKVLSVTTADWEDDTVEYLNKGHIGGIAFVRCLEISASRSLVLNYYMYGKLIPFHEVCTL